MRPRRIPEKQYCEVCNVAVAAGWICTLAPKLVMPLCDDHICCPECGAGARWLELESSEVFRFRCRRCLYEKHYRARVLADIKNYHIGEKNEDS